MLYVLSGRGVLLTGSEEIEVGPGDFLGFQAPSIPHLLTNPFEEEQVYLVGGERRRFEVADFPRHGKKLVREQGRIWMVDADRVEPFGSGGGGG